MDNEQNERVFSSISSIYDPFLKLATLGRISKWQEELLLLTKVANRHLDIGTGTGEVIIKSKSGLRVGIDLSLKMLKIAKLKDSKCNFILADALRLPFKDGSFNLITLSLTYRHLPDREAFLKEARRVLQSSGELCLLEIARPPKFLISMIWLFGFLPGVLIFGLRNWKFFLKSIENSKSLEEVIIELKSYGFEPISIRKKLFSAVFLICNRRTS